MKVALLHNLRPATTPPGAADDVFEEYDRAETIAAIAAALAEIGARVEPVAADRRLPWRLDEGRYDLAFNIAEGAGRRCREAVPAAVCELLGLPVTGSDALTLAVTLDKAMARRVVSPEVPVAAGALIESEADEHALVSLRYPVLVKPNDEGSSKGIGPGALVGDPGSAGERCRWLRAQLRLSRARGGVPARARRSRSASRATAPARPCWERWRSRRPRARRRSSTRSRSSVTGAGASATTCRRASRAPCWRRSSGSR